MARPEILELPNLVSLYRIAIVPVVGYFLSLEGNQPAAIATILVLSAGASDGLDGYLARKMKTTGRLGIVLDPICDKIFAALLIMLLIPFRGLPFWLAGIIIGRDLLIALGGIIIIKSENVTTPSNMAGKYAFAAIALLLGSYVLRFDFGIQAMTAISLLFITASMIGYFRLFRSIRKGAPLPQFRDKPRYKLLRYSVMGCFLIWFVWHLLRFIQTEYMG